MISAVLPVRPYRCTECKSRFWDLDSPLLTDTRILLLLLVVLALVMGLGKALFSIQAKGSRGPARVVSAPPPQIAPVAIGDQELVGEVPPATQPGRAAVQVPAPAVADKALTEPMAQTAPPVSEADAGDEGLPVGEPELSTGVVSEVVPAAGDVVVDEVPAAEPVAEPRTYPAATQPTPIVVTGGAQPSRIEAYELRVKKGTISLRIKADAPITEFRNHYLGYKNVLYYDLPGEWTLDGQLPTELAVDYPGMGPIRTGRHADYLRIVFSLEQLKHVDTQAQPTRDGILITIRF